MTLSQDTIEHQYQREAFWFAYREIRSVWSVLYEPAVTMRSPVIEPAARVRIQTGRVRVCRTMLGRQRRNQLDRRPPSLAR